MPQHFHDLGRHGLSARKGLCSAMKITSGLFNHMVLQRNVRNVSEARFSGTAVADGILQATVHRGRRVLPGFSALILGAAKRGRFEACLRGIPAGGPYHVSLQVTDATGGVVDSCLGSAVLVGDVWLLGGQSNMQGIGLLRNGLRTDPLVRAFYMNDRWAPAKDPIHNLWQAVDQVHLDLNGGAPHVKSPGVGACPGPSFGQEMRRLTGGIPQGLIACAHGGTSMSQWDPALKKLGAGSLYGAMLRRFRKNGSSVAGLLWYQGCSDATDAAATAYTGRMKRFVTALRRDCGAPRLPVALVQIARVIGWGSDDKAGAWNSIQDQQRRLQQGLNNCAVVPAIDLELDDAIHIGGAGQLLLGRRLACAMNVLRQGSRAGKPPISFQDISVVTDRGIATVIIRFGNVVGGLRAAGRPSGFHVVARNSITSSVFDVKLHRTTVFVRTIDPPANATEKFLHYGQGFDPVCNITDGAGRSIPVFGPVPLASPHPVYPSTHTLRVGKLRMSAGNLDGMRLPTIKSLALERREFPGIFCERSSEIQPHAARDPMLTYACDFRCARRMKLLIMLGHGGPLKMWIDGRERFYEPNGTNNAMPDMVAVPFNAGRGIHKLIIAMGTNRGNAWGIYLRIVKAGRAGNSLTRYNVMRHGALLRRNTGLTHDSALEILG